MVDRVISDAEVLGIMADGGRKLCDYALEQWWSGKYGLDHAATQVMIAEWKEKQARIGPLTRRLKALLRESERSLNGRTDG